MSKEYQHFLGKEKHQIKEEIGQEFNYYAHDVWTYLLKTNWLGRKTYLVIIFENDIVISAEINRDFNFKNLI